MKKVVFHLRKITAEVFNTLYEMQISYRIKEKLGYLNQLEYREKYTA